MIIRPTQEQTRRVLRKRTYIGPGFGPRSFECLGIGIGLGIGLNSGAGLPADVDFTALGAAFWIDASRPASYTASGTTLTSLVSLISGTPLTTVTGVPQIVTSPRDGKPAFNFAGGAAPAYIRGSDATAQAVVAGTNLPRVIFSVVSVLECTANGMWLSVMNGASASGGEEVGQLSTSPGYLTVDKQGASGYKAQTVTKTPAGTVVVCQRTVDGLTWFVSVNGGAETSTTLTTAGAVTANQTCIGAAGHATPTVPYGGYLHEVAMIGGATAAGMTAGQCAAISTTLKAKWGRPIQVRMVGDSITTGQLATNGGMGVLLANAVRAAGGKIDLQGPIAYANGAGGQVWYPHRYSAVSGNTCSAMNTRETSATQGLGTAAGHYLDTDLVCLMAGTNMETDAATSLNNYATLLNNIYAGLAAGNKPPKILVTTICEVTANLAYSQAFNAGLPAVWATFDAAHPGVLEYWDANAANPNDGSATYFLDGTHPNDAGYVRLCNDATNGLIQAALPIIMSLQ